MKQPLPEHLAPLSLVERTAYRCGDWCNRNLKTPLTWWNYTMMNILIWFGLSRRLHIHGLENIAHITADKRIVLVCNHRTFFDFFVVSWVTFNKTDLPKRIFFPVRSTFFYTTWIGIPFCFFMGGYAMFPPIFRGNPKRIFNQYALKRIKLELQTQGCIIGFHPEGTRNKDPDPHSLLPPKKGVGEVLNTTPESIVVPVYIKGITNNLIREFFCNWFKASQSPIDVYFGEPPNLDHLFTEKQLGTTHQNIAQACMASIQTLATEHQKLRP